MLFLLFLVLYVAFSFHDKNKEKQLKLNDVDDIKKSEEEMPVLKSDEKTPSKSVVPKKKEF